MAIRSNQNKKITKKARLFIIFYIFIMLFFLHIKYFTRFNRHFWFLGGMKRFQYFFLLILLQVTKKTRIGHVH